MNVKSDPANRSHAVLRRQFLGRSASMAFGTLAASSFGLAGCRRESSPATPPGSNINPSVPLRVALLGQAEHVAAIEQSWSAVSEQPLRIELTELERHEPSELMEFLDAASRNDILVYPIAMLGDMTDRNLVIDYAENDLDAFDAAIGKPFVAVRNTSLFAGKISAIPLGARLPAILAIVPIPALENWQTYDRWVHDDLAGKAAEPLAPGWAGAMFLWRAASTSSIGWLFGRENLDPLITEPAYVEVLEQLRNTSARYESERLTPNEIWQHLSTGKLQSGIGFPFTPAIEGLAVGDLPNELAQARVLLDLFTPVASISAGCRQSAAAKQFIMWLSGGDGSESLRRRIPSLTRTREPSLEASMEVSGAPTAGGYEAWLHERLQTAATLPILQLHAALDYYQALDDQVGRCLDGKSTPTEALSQVAQQWQALTDKVGREKQVRAWRRSQGMRS